MIQERSFLETPQSELKLFQNHMDVVNQFWDLLSRCTVWSLRPRRKRVKSTRVGIRLSRLGLPLPLRICSALASFLASVSCNPLSENCDQNWAYLRGLVGGLTEINYIKSLGKHLPSVSAQ